MQGFIFAVLCAKAQQITGLFLNAFDLAMFAHGRQQKLETTSIFELDLFCFASKI